jgi:hypothetical protein
MICGGRPNKTLPSAMISEKCILALSLDRGGIQSSLLWATLTAFAIPPLFGLWDRRARRLGRPTTPPYVPLTVAAAVYFGWIRFLMPSMAVFDSFDRPSEIAQITDPEKLLRLIQAQHSAILGVVTLIDWTVFVFFLVAVIFVSRWLATRTDDRNWTHGGIRPSPKTCNHGTDKPTNP